MNINFKGIIDYLTYKKYYTSTIIKKPIIIIIGLAVIGILIYSLRELILGNSLANIIPFLIIAIVWLVVILRIAVFQVKTKYNQTFILNEEHEYTLTNDFIRLKGELFDTTMKWSSFIKYKETEGFFLLFENSLAAIHIPKNLMQINEIEEFRSFVKIQNWK